MEVIIKEVALRNKKRFLISVATCNCTKMSLPITLTVVGKFISIEEGMIGISEHPESMERIKLENTLNKIRDRFINVSAIVKLNSVNELIQIDNSKGFWIEEGKIFTNSISGDKVPVYSFSTRKVASIPLEEELNNYKLLLAKRKIPSLKN